MDSKPDTGATHMTPAQLRHATAELDFVRRRLELLFWTIATGLALIVLAAMTVAFIVSLIRGPTMDHAMMEVGAGITAASAVGGQILRLLPHRWKPPA